MNEVEVIPKATPFIKFGPKRQMTYKGLNIRADEGIHDQIVYFLNKVGVDLDGAKVLDWGCGTGALSQRLSDLGADVLSVDMDSASFGANTAFEYINFDDRRSYGEFLERHKGIFDVVIASEVIEHVENPWNYARSIKKLLKPTGMAMISTPNTGSMLSRLTFLRTGNIFQFEETDLVYGHITPISHLKMKKICKDVGLSPKCWASAGVLPIVWLGPSFKYLMYSVLSVSLRPFLTGTLKGWCLMYAVYNEPGNDEVD